MGPTDSGKSTLTKTLLNWAVRSAWEPTFVDLDIGGCRPARRLLHTRVHKRGHGTSGQHEWWVHAGLLHTREAA